MYKILLCLYIKETTRHHKIQNHENLKKGGDHYEDFRGRPSVIPQNSVVTEEAHGQKPYWFKTINIIGLIKF
jgi:hypothetical protein